MAQVLDRDTIKARVFPDPRNPERFNAEFLSIIKRARETMVGTLVRDEGHLFLKPDELRVQKWVATRPGQIRHQVGQKAVVKITRWPSQDARMEGDLVEVLGFPDDPGVDIQVVVRKYQWPERFHQAVETQAAQFPENPAERDFAGRRDLRKVPILTIDGPDAKDFDDAISLERTPSGNYRLGVHIADVSHYVQEDSPLDQEARTRATSVYLADRVIPMLPHSLSDGLCSLREGVPRLTLSAFLEYDQDGKSLGAEFAPTVIQSTRRGIYGEVQQVLENEASPDVASKYESLKPMLGQMRDLARLIRRRREQNGSLDFDFPEVRAVLNSEGRVVDVRKLERLGTHMLIEDFMVAANEAVADYLSRQKIPSVYRIHEPPTPRDLEDLTTFLRAYRVPFKNLDLTTPPGLRSLLESVKGHSLEPVISTLALRSLKLAVYATRNAGHFGLGLKSYCHFTSPIRRYPDLVVHRSLKKALQAAAGKSTHAYDKLSLHCSLQERTAEKMERETQKLMQLRFMANKIGGVYEGPIRHMTAYGAFVELNPYGIEGFLSLDSLGSGFVFEPGSLIMRNRRGDTLHYGDVLKVKVESVDAAFQRLVLTRHS